MDKYKYKIKTPNGDVIKDIMYASSYDELTKLVNETGSTLISVKKYKEKKDLFESVIKSNELSIFCEKLYIMLKSGISLIQSIDVVIENLSDKKFKYILSEISKDLQTGVSFDSCLEKFNNYFPPLFKMMIKVGMIAGNLTEIMEYLWRYYLKDYQIKKKVKSSMIYPIILLVVTVLVFLLLVFLVIPQFESSFRNISFDEIPKITKIVFNTSSFIRNNFIWILLVVFIFIFILLIFLNKKNSVFKDYLKLKIPIFGRINSWVITSKFTRSLSMMYLNGINLSKAIEETNKIIDNLYLKKKLDYVLDNILKGKSLSGSLREIKFFPSMLVEMISIGENTNQLGSVLKSLSNYYDNESDNEISKLTVFLEPIIIIIVALIISVVVISIFVPMFGMMDTIMEV